MKTKQPGSDFLLAFVICLVLPAIVGLWWRHGHSGSLHGKTTMQSTQINEASIAIH